MVITLTHWGRVTHICVGNLTIIASDNGLSPGRRQAIIWNNAGILLIGPLGTNFSEILIEIKTFSFKKMDLKMSSGKWRPSCLGLNVLIASCVTSVTSTVYPKKYAHGFVVLCFVVVMQSFIMNSHEVFIHIHQGYFDGTGAIVRLPQCQWSKPDGYGKISQCITTTKHSKAKTVCIFLGIYCMMNQSDWCLSEVRERVNNHLEMMSKLTMQTFKTSSIIFLCVFWWLTMFSLYYRQQNNFQYL